MHDLYIVEGHNSFAHCFYEQFSVYHNPNGREMHKVPIPMVALIVTVISAAYNLPLVCVLMLISNSFMLLSKSGVVECMLCKNSWQIRSLMYTMATSTLSTISAKIESMHFMS